MGDLWYSGKLDKCKVSIIYSKYTLISKQINLICSKASIEHIKLYLYFIEVVKYSSKDEQFKCEEFLCYTMDH